MPNVTIPEPVARALRPLMTRKVAWGAAVALAVGVGLGAWLEPPKPHYGTQTLINLPQEPANTWGEAANGVSTLPYSQPESSPSMLQTASVSPADAPATVQLAQADQREVIASGDTSHAAQPVEATASQVTWTRPAPTAAPQPQSQGRDWAAYDVRDRGARYGGEARDDSGDLPPPPRWRQQPPEPRFAAPSERRWDFRPDGNAIPLDDQDDGG